MVQGFVVSVYLANLDLLPELQSTINQIVASDGAPIGSATPSGNNVNLRYTCHRDIHDIMGSIHAEFRARAKAAADMIADKLNASPILQPSAKLNSVTYYVDMTHAHSLEAQVQELTATVHHLQHENRHLQHENGHLQHENGELRDRLAQLESLVAQLEGLVAQLNSKCESLVAQLSNK